MTQPVGNLGCCCGGHGPAFVTRSVRGNAWLSAWNNFCDQWNWELTGVPKNSDRARKYFTKIVTSNNSQGVIVLNSSGRVGVPILHHSLATPIVNTYRFDPVTYVPSSNFSLAYMPVNDSGYVVLVLKSPYFFGDPPTLWTHLDFGDGSISVGDPPFPLGGGWVANKVDYTVSTQHTYYAGPALQPGFAAYENRVELSDEVDFSAFASPLHNAIDASDYALWNQTHNLEINRYQGFVGNLNFAQINGVDLSTLDFSQFDASITPFYATPVLGAQSFACGSLTYEGSEFGDNAMGFWTGAKTEVMFLRRAQYVITKYDILNGNNFSANPVIIEQGQKEAGDIITLDQPALFIPTYDDAPINFKIGTRLVLTAT